MINTLPETNFERISLFENAVFYCVNSSSQNIPVGVVRNVSITQDNLLEFKLSHFPVLENCWNVFAGELHFYKKGLPFNLKVHGTAWFACKDELTVQFKVLHIECFGEPEEKHASLQEALADFFNTTGLFFKKMLVTGF